MLSKSQIQLISSLGTNKFRKINMKFVAEGNKMVQELFKSNLSTEMLFATEDWLKENRMLRNNEFEIICVKEDELKKISSLKTPNKVLAIVNIPSVQKEIPDFSTNLILMLDYISDPGNMGTIIRTADWFGIKNIICSENCVDIYNPKVVQATMGSIFRLNIQYKNLEEILHNLEISIPVYGMLLDGNNLYDTAIENNGVIVVGNESHGISTHLIKYIKSKISIPGYSIDGTNQPESLNASIAAAIVLAEFKRRYPN
jgi:RNA methyltransferase, TrmH family